MIRLVGILFAGFALMCLGAQDKDATGKDTKQLQGTWEAVKINSEELPPDKDKKITLTFKGNSITSSLNKKLKFKIDAGKKPKQIDFYPEDKDQKKVLGIYKLENGTLTICTYHIGMGQPRPKNFRVAPGKEMFVLEMKRVDKK